MEDLIVVMDTAAQKRDVVIWNVSMVCIGGTRVYLCRCAETDE